MKTETELFENAIDTTTVNDKSIREYITEHYVSRNVIEDIKAEVKTDADWWLEHGEDLRYSAVMDVLDIIDKQVKGGD